MSDRPPTFFLSRLFRTALAVALIAGGAAGPVAAQSRFGLIEDPDRPSGDWCEGRKLGTWFYCARPKRPDDKPVPPPPQPSASQQLDVITAQLKELRAKAILDPTEANITAYVRFQREQLDRSSLFADVWQRALWQDPSLDYTLERPVGTLAKNLFTSARSEDRSRVIASLRDRFGLFYFFRSDCQPCRVFSPILKSVADSHGLTVMAVSTDGGPSETFPRYAVDSGQRRRMGLTDDTVPAVVLFDASTKTTIPVAHGLIAADDLMERIYVLVSKEPGRDY
jgi:conjugal transfer pilus assembly protein TraF